MTDTHVLVIGLGVAGASALHALARRGIPAIGLEAQSPGHTQGSSHGASRITRTAVGEGVEYVPLVKRSDEIWAGLEAQGHDLRRPTGVLYLAEPGAGVSLHGAADFLAATRAAGQAAGVTLEPLDSATLRQRFPQFTIPDGAHALFEPGAGVLRPEACLTALCSDAARLGATLRYNERVQTLSADAGKVIADTPAGRYRANRVILAMGAWTPAFAGGGFARDMRVLRQVQYWFETEQDAGWTDAPAFIWFHGATADDSFYGFPILAGGQRAVKVATEQYAVMADPDQVDRSVSAAEAAALYKTHVRGRLAGVTDRCVEALACLYTHNINPAHPGRFRIAPHPDVAGTTVISACSGHGFKHAAGVGDAVVGQMFGEAPFCDLSVFAG